MKVKLFGRELFETTRENRGPYLINEGFKRLEESKYLPDFHKMFNRDDALVRLQDYAVLSTVTSGSSGMVAVPIDKKPEEEVKPDVTPKELYVLKTLNDDKYELNVDPEYVNKQIADFTDKLGMLKSTEYDMRNATSEVGSILIRMQNRLKYTEVKDFFEQFPYTTSTKIAEVVKNHKNLQLGDVSQFLAEMPDEATKLMKDYSKKCKSICEKEAIFYIIADKKDFQRTQSKRDPILLAQSPFAHTWQVLGAWDDEMMFLEEL